MSMPILAGLAHAILGYTPAPEQTPDPIAAPLRVTCSEDDLIGMRYVIARGISGASRVTHDERMTALSGLESMAIRHPERLAKLLTAAQRDDTHMYRAVLVLAEYARTRRTP